jgi:hypothetical protein
MAIKHLLLKIYGLSDIIIKEIKIHRDVAQLGSAIASGVIGLSILGLLSDVNL